MTKKEKLKKLQKRLEWISSVFGKIEDRYNEKIRTLRKKIREEEMEAKKKEEEVTALVTSDKTKKSPVKAQSKAKTNKKTPANKKKTTNAGKKSSNRK